MSVRVRRNYRLPGTLMMAVSAFCDDNDMTETYYVESLIRADMKKRNRAVVQRESVRTWDGVDDMPLLPKMKIVERAG